MEAAPLENSSAAANVVPAPAAAAAADEPNIAAELLTKSNVVPLPDWRLNCQAAVIRAGEIFGEFGIEFISEDGEQMLEEDLCDIDRWHLCVMQMSFTITDDGQTAVSEEVVFDEMLSMEKRRKVVKLEASQQFKVLVRAFNRKHCLWSEWGVPAVTATLHPVTTMVKEIGEDYARIQWDRAPRGTAGLSKEREPNSTAREASIVSYELRFIRERNMKHVYQQIFETGERSYTIRKLTPGTAYIVMARYQTLINTATNWVEVARFYTEAALEVSLETRGDNVYSVQWKRGTLFDTEAALPGYALPQTSVHQYEISLKSAGGPIAPVRVPSTERFYRFTGLHPSTAYEVRVRALSTQGFWGSWSDVLEVRTADLPVVSAIATGETFLSFGWTRTHEEEESQIEYCVQGVGTEYKQQKTLNLDSTTPKAFHIESLHAGCDYGVSIRSYLNGEWGSWTTAKVFSTHAKASLTFVERGENFFTLAWSTPGHSVDAEGVEVPVRYNVVVARRDPANAEETVLLDTEVVRQYHEPGVRVGDLDGDCEYKVCSRTWQFNPITGYEGWGSFSTPVLVRTVQPVPLSILDLGEDFAQITWKRGMGENLSNANAETAPDIKYEVMVHNVDAEEDCILHKQVMDTSYTVTNLRPASTYIISVRSCDENGFWGLWAKVTFRTLSAVVTSIHEIAEDFVRLMWQRLPSEAEDEEKNTGVTTADCFVSKYSVFVYSKEMLESDVVSHPTSGYHAGGSSDVTRHEVVTSDFTSLKIRDLLPDREYVAVVRAATLSGKWGLWSIPVRFRTNTQFSIPVNHLGIGENYVRLAWSRDESPIVDEGVMLGDMTVTGQELRVQGVLKDYSKEYSIAPDVREKKLYDLAPACAYTIQIRVRSKSGCWGLWSPPVHILTRGTMLTKAVEVADDYAVVSWERRKVPNPKNYPTGKGLVTTYHLRVYNKEGIHSETFLAESDCPYRITGLSPNTYYCVELKANYSDEEWGLWSAPMWCLTMQPMTVKAKLISEEFCSLAITRPEQQRRLPDDDGNYPAEDMTVAFGDMRPTVMLCITSPIITKAPHSAAAAKPKYSNQSLPPEAADHRLIYQTETTFTSKTTEHTVVNLRSNSVYTAFVRSKLPGGEWGMWSEAHWFATVPSTCVEFQDIGENFVKVEWKRHPQRIPPQVKEPEKVTIGAGAIGSSRLRIRELGGSYQHMYTIEGSSHVLHVDSLKPATTYAVAVQTYNDNYDWGVWSAEGKVRTVPGMNINIQHVFEDALWVSWARRTDLADVCDTDTALNMNITAKAYEVRITGGGHFNYTKEMDSCELFFRGLQPDAVYKVHVRAQFTETGEWGLWSSHAFHTKPRMRVTFGSIGEHFVMLEWRRHLPQAKQDDPETRMESEDVIHQFRFKVQRVGDIVPFYFDLGPTVSSYCLRGLLPSSEYRVWMCAKGYDGVWGYWNEETRVRTQPKLLLNVDNIGEDYVRVNWKRGQWEGESMPEDGTEVRQVDAAANGYRIRVLDRHGEVVASQMAGWSETGCVMSGLQLATLYSVEVSAKDTYDEWGLWSDPRYFITLNAAEISIMQIGETFVDVEWARCGEFAASEDEGEGGSMADITEDGDTSTQAGGAAESVATTTGSAALRVISEISHSTAGSDVSSEEYFIPKDTIIEDGAASLWHIRIQCKRVFGGVPETEEYKEYFAEPTENWRRIEDLLPNSTYLLSVRAKNRAGEWGHWSPATPMSTYPVLVATVDAVSETFATLTWERPPYEEDVRLVCFPPPADIHNYQVSIRPLHTELPFNEQDEPLVDGARVYETTQPSLRLGNLLPGTRYITTVREQVIDEKGKPIAGVWGAVSDVRNIQTSPPLRVLPIEIGEQYCLVEWKRVEREDDEKGFACSHTVSKSIEFEVQVVRLADDGVSKYQGALAMDSVESLLPNIQQYHIDNLHHNSIYAVQVRAKGESGAWGLWSPVTKFVTLSRLVLSIQSVYETHFYTSWHRPLPLWAESLGEEEVNTSADGESMDVSPLREVALGDYSIQQYEVVIRGISTEYERTVSLGREDMSYCAHNLLQNNIYTVCVRSLSEKQHWSVFSNKCTLLTLAPMHVTVQHFTESAAVVQWLRDATDVQHFTALLNKCRAEAERLCDERERRDLFELKRRLQDMENRGEEVSGWLDQATRQEHNAILREDAISHLRPENVVVGDEACTAYQLRLFGAHGHTPFIRHLDQLRLPSCGKEQALRQSSKKRFETAAADIAVTSLTSPPGGEPTSALREEISVLDKGILLDVQLQHSVGEVVILSLTPSSDFTLRVSARNGRDEWQPWSDMVQLRTLAPITLSQSRFGEHYINLFWHRMEAEATNEMEMESHQFDELHNRYRTFTQQDLDTKKEELSAEEYENVVEELKEMRNLRRKIQDRRQELADGKAIIMVDPNTPIQGYLVRIVKEGGGFSEHYLENKPDAGAAFTATGLQPNRMYVCLLCADYGNDIWGKWSAPLKFMTQNLIQLQLTYMGESFVDIEWQRMDNKQLPLIDRKDTITSSLFSDEEQVYQVRITHEDLETGNVLEEFRDMTACNMYRIGGLKTDTKYTIAVREWDAKGDWGLWCTPRTCVTLPGTFTVVEDIGEDFANVSWGRKERRVDYDNDMHVLQYGVETINYYLRVQELEDNGDEEVLENTVNSIIPGAHAPTQDADGEPKSDETLEGIFENTTRDGKPQQCTPEEFEGEDRRGNYRLVKKFSPDESNIILQNLKPNRFYTVQVLGETSGGQLGVWSGDTFMLTKAKIVLQADFIEEAYVDYSWVRPEPRQHPRLDMSNVFVGEYNAVHYDLEATGPDFTLNKELDPTITSYHMAELRMNAVYVVKVRSVNSKDQVSLWSDQLSVATLQPVTIVPVQITETSIGVEWGRAEQVPSNYPATPTPLQVGNRPAANYHVRIVRVSPEGKHIQILDKTFAGDVKQLEVPALPPNTPHIMMAREENERGEWSRWSEGRIAYTMKLIRGSIAAVGEDFVRFMWEREAPDELITASPVSGSEESSSAGEVVGGTHSPTRKSQRFPVCDRPADVTPVYRSVRTNITMFAIAVQPTGEPEGYTLEVPSGDKHAFTIPSLKPDTIYSVSVRACYGNGEWGPWSESVLTGTYNLLALELKDVGEDFFSVGWQRRANVSDMHMLNLGKVEETICYEIAVHDFTNVPFGEDDTVVSEAHPVLQTLFMHAKQRSCIVKELQANRRYRASVRRWYQPLNDFLPEFTVVEADTDDAQLKERIVATNAVPGAWSEAEYAVTLRLMVCSIDSIGEDFFSFHWERDPRAKSLPVRKNNAAKPPQNFQVRIDELLPDGSDQDRSGDSYHVEELLPPTDFKFIAQGLHPDRVYRVDVRCCIEKVWGLWSSVKYVRTLSTLEVEVSNIGEDCACIAWSRKFCPLTLPDGSEAILGDNDSNDKFQLDVAGVGFSFQVSKRFKGTRMSYNLKHLEASAVYNVRVRSCDSVRTMWSLWSDPVHFATLMPLKLSVGPPGEQFARMEWHREEQSASTYTDMVEGPVILGDPEVLAYHLCVFNTQNVPSQAVLDKQLRKDVNNFRVTTLAPDTPYVAVVRGCNTSSQWGLWSEEKAFRTMHLLQLQIEQPGETYLNLKWDREGGDREELAQATNYRFVLRSEAGLTERMISPEDCTKDELGLTCYHLEDLTPNTHYTAALQPCYGEGNWGLWSKALNVTTLSTISVNVKSAQNRVELSWSRASHTPAVGFRIPGEQQPTTAEGDGNTLGFPLDMAESRPVPTVQKYQLFVCRSEDVEYFTGKRKSSQDPGQDDLTAINNMASIPDQAGMQSEVEEANVIPDMDEDEVMAVKTSVAAAAKVEPFKIEREFEVNTSEGDDNMNMTLDQLEKDTLYAVRIRALDGNGEWGAWSETDVYSPPKAPQRVVLRKVNAQYCSLQWEAPEGKASQYRYVIEQLYTNPPQSSNANSGRGGSNAGPLNPLLNEWRVVDTVEDTVCPIRIMGPLNRLRCRVKCTRRGGTSYPYSDFSDPVSLSSGTPPGPVEGLRVVSLTRGSATLEWDAPPKPSESSRYTRPVFRIYLTAPGYPPVMVTFVHRPTFTLSDLAPSSEYTVQVVAENADGMSYRNPMIRFCTKGEADETTAQEEEGMPPLGTIVEPSVVQGDAPEGTNEQPSIPVAKGLAGPTRPKGAPVKSGRTAGSVMAAGTSPTAADSAAGSGSKKKRSGSAGKKKKRSGSAGKKKKRSGSAGKKKGGRRRSRSRSRSRSNSAKGTTLPALARTM